MTNAYIISACRTPFGKYGGALKDVRPDDMAGLVIKEAVRYNLGLIDFDIHSNSIHDCATLFLIAPQN